MRNEKTLKTIDVIAWSLLTIGGLNWGLVGIFGFNLVAAIFGDMSILSRLVFTLVGLSAIYEVFGIKSIANRWHLHYASTATS